MTETLLACVAVLSLVSAAAATVAGLWARSAAHKIDDFATIVFPLLRPKTDPTGDVVAAAAAAPREDDPEQHSATIPMEAPASGVPETGPSRSEDRPIRSAAYFLPYVAPPEPPPSDALSGPIGATPPPFDRRRAAEELGQATERERQLAARKQRETEAVHQAVQPLTEAEASRPSGEGFAMDRPSWESGATGVYDRSQVEATVAAAAAPIGRVQRVPSGAVRGRGEERHASPRTPAAPPRPRPPGARPDVEVTQLSEGVARRDPRAE